MRENRRDERQAAKRETLRRREVRNLKRGIVK